MINKGATARKLKIAFFLERFPCVSETFILNQIVYLKDQGHSIDIYANTQDKGPLHANVLQYHLLDRTQYAPRPLKMKQRVTAFLKALAKVDQWPYLVKAVNVFKYGKSALSLRMYFKYLPYSKTPKYDIIHAHFGHRANEVIDLKKFGIFRHTPLVTTFHGYDINPLKIESYKHTYKDLFAQSSLITANSLFTLNLLKDAGCPESKIIKLPVSLDTTFFQKKWVRKTDDTLNILFCGRLIEFKAPDLFIEVAHHLVSEKGYKNLRFHIIGSGPLRERVDKQVAGYQLADYVVFHGSLTQEEIIAKMSAMDIFLYPGIYDKATGRAENQGLVIQEAQSLELPVVTSNVGGIPEGLLDGRTGFVVAERDIPGFASKVEALILDPDLRDRMAKNARAYVIENFDNQVIGRKLEENYYALL